MTETRSIGQRVIWAGMSLCALCLAYFYMLDRIWFSSTNFSPIFRLLLVPDGEVAWIAVAICCLAALWNRPAPILRLVEFLGERAAWVAWLSAAAFALGAVAILLVWLYVTAYIVLAGAELNGVSLRGDSDDRDS